MARGFFGRPHEGLVSGEDVAHRSFDEARQNYRYADVVACEHRPHRIPPSFERGFAGAVGWRNGHTAQGCDRANQRDVATTARAHSLGHWQRGVERTVEVRIDDAGRAPLSFPVVGVSKRTRHACVGDEEIDGMFVVKFVELVAYGSGIADVK